MLVDSGNGEEEDKIKFFSYMPNRGIDIQNQFYLAYLTLIDLIGSNRLGTSAM